MEKENKILATERCENIDTLYINKFKNENFQEIYCISFHFLSLYGLCSVTKHPYFLINRFKNENFQEIYYISFHFLSLYGLCSVTKHPYSLILWPPYDL